MRGHESIAADRLSGFHPGVIEFRIGADWVKPFRPRHAEPEELREYDEFEREHPTVYTEQDDPVSHDLRFVHGMNVLAFCDTANIGQWARWVGAIADATPFCLTMVTDDGAATTWYLGVRAGQTTTTELEMA